MVAIALSTALWFVVSDPFGEDLATYVQACSTLVLIAVTVSYVVATLSMAETTQAQLDLTREDPSRRAIDAVWRAATRSSTALGSLNIEARDYAATALAEPNTAVAGRARFQALAAEGVSLSPVLRDNRHLLPKAIESAADGLLAIAVHSKLFAEALEIATWNEIQVAMDGGKTATLESVESRWSNDGRVQVLDAPTWSQYTGDFWVDKLYQAVVAFQDSTSPYFQPAPKP